MEILGIDVGGSGIKGAPVDVSSGKLLTERFRLETPQPATPKAIAQTVSEVAAVFKWSGPIGCAFPARIKSGTVCTAANIDKSWIGTDAASLFQKATGCPTVVINDADAAGLAEIAFGAGRERDGVVLMLTFGTGIGSGLFMDGELVPNIELGHLFLDGRVAEHLSADSARKREQLSWEAWAARVQNYLDHVEFVFAPDHIIMGGGVSRPKKRELYFHLLKTEANLIPAQFQNEAGIAGAAYAAHLASVKGKTI